MKHKDTKKFLITKYYSYFCSMKAIKKEIEYLILVRLMPTTVMNKLNDIIMLENDINGYVLNRNFKFNQYE